MTRYLVSITTTFSMDIPVEAEDEDEAWELAHEVFEDKDDYGDIINSDTSVIEYREE